MQPATCNRLKADNWKKRMEIGSDGSGGEAAPDELEEVSRGYCRDALLSHLSSELHSTNRAKPFKSPT